MKLCEYLSQSEDEQYESIWANGVRIHSIQLGDSIYQLYAVNDFFVEIELSRYECKIVGKRQFKYGMHLEKYLP